MTKPHSASVKRRLLMLALCIGCGTVVYALLARLSLVAPPQDLLSTLCLPTCEADRSVHQISSVGAVDSQPILERLEDDFDKEKISILVEKSDYRLTVFYNLEPVKTYSVVFGSEPVGDKFAEGDRKTPEGIYRVRDLYPHPEWSRFIWLDYPTPQDWREHTQAKLAGVISPTATIGSEIGIHGVPEGADGLIDSRNNWTWGCVSLKNSDVDEIYSVVQQGTVIEVVP